MKKNNLKKVSSLLRKKSTSYLKISFVVFIISLVIISSVSVVGISQFTSLQQEFLKNDNTHIIAISGIETGGNFESLTIKEKETIQKIVKKTVPNTKFELFTQTSIPMGISDSEGNHYSFTVVDNDSARWLKADKLEDNTIYVHSKKDLPSEVMLLLPIVTTLPDGGMVSDDEQEYKIKLSSTIGKNNVFETYTTFPGVHYYINYNTYLKMVSVMYGQTEAEIQKHETLQIYLYIEDLGKMEEIASVLADKGYATDYTLKAFDSLDSTVQSIIKASFVLILLIFVFTCINLTLSFDSYLKLQKKDIAILKHLGYEKKDIGKIYRNNIFNIFLKLCIGITVYTLILGMVVININQWPYLVGIILLIIAALALIYGIIEGIVLKKYIKKNILELMKLDKQFE